ncbi:ATP synthase regulation protein NCA2-domain-containing protein [Lineolata rhizophorae]|uniref:ATP synthase regulation protein NCA2-domain-containing protein n=1 Tax=Lineolata rhizophorae TaxID=578093 RepID=A0A6A6P1R0_9PEZI|nr:ATP synthase regulation protein NCA2-domain-containing protein [Lineolata rhizophorae]
MHHRDGNGDGDGCVSARRGGRTLARGWRKFYGLVRQVVRERSVEDWRTSVVGPLALVRHEARGRQDVLKRVRRINANALGVLLGEGMVDEILHNSEAYASQDDGAQRWKVAVAKSVALMDAVLKNVADSDLTLDSFEDAIARTTNQDEYFKLHAAPAGEIAEMTSPRDMSERLQFLLRHRLLEYKSTFDAVVKENGMPSRLVRYWLPATALLLSSSTILRIAVNRQEEIITWIREFGQTVIDFWGNWIVAPIKQIIGTIRHDEGSMVSLMSKRSLEGDRDSLERMVVDFAVENPPDNGSLTDAQISDIQAGVREGDLTPVLMAYERDLKKPLVGAVKGNLIRALLIQIQKTKVDVEVAMGGIDSLLKSQELVFGFVGITPSILICIGVFRWLGGVFGSRKGLRIHSRQRELIRILRNIDRILTSATLTEGELYYKDHGMLLCEVHVLRQTAHQVLPKGVFRDFLEDLEELVDIRTGVERQLKVVQRMRWAYSKYL